MADDEDDPFGGDEEGGDRPLGPAGAIFWTVAYLALVLYIVFPASTAMRPGLATDLVNQEICSVLAIAVVVYGMARWHLPSRPLDDTLALRASNPAILLLALLLGVALQVPLVWLTERIEARWPRDAQEIAEHAALFHFTSTWHKAIAAAALAALGPFFEEVFFRGVMYRALRLAVTPGIAIVTTAAAFAAIHVDPRSLPYVFLAGLVLGFLRAATGSLVVPIVAHMAFNGVETFLLLSGVDSSDKTETIHWTIGAFGAGVVLILLVAIAAIARRSVVAEAARKEDSR